MSTGTAKQKLVIFDTTLRDGEQSPGASMTAEEKYEVALQLARMNVDVIEAGFPISSEGDFESVRCIARGVKGPRIAGLARARDADIDRCWEAVSPAEKSRIHTFIATSDIHMEHKLKMSPEAVLAAAVSAVQRARGYTEDVEFSAEDAVRTRFEFLRDVVKAVIDAGATTINIPDTVGYALPWQFGPLIARLIESVEPPPEVVISVHCHNDLGLASANSLSAVAHGARQVECTINGLGERAGNASLEEVVMAIRTRHAEFPLRVDIDTAQIIPTSRLVQDVTGIRVQPNKAIVGANAFAHEAGIHVHGVMCDASTYEIMDAKAVGLAESSIVLGKHSGMHAFRSKVDDLGLQVDETELARAFHRFKDLADKKKTVTDDDIRSLVADEAHHTETDTYVLEYLHVVGGAGIRPTATVQLAREGQVLTQAGIGVGSVDAIYRTIAAIIGVPHDLIDYSVKSVTGGTDALGEVTVKIGARRRVFSGRAANEDILEASARAYIQALNKLIYFAEHRAGDA
jgi:2-isopropylmalate synthase